MNHFASVCDTRLKVTVLRYEPSKSTIYYHSESLPFHYLGMSPEIQYLSEEKCSLLLHLNRSFLITL